MLGSNKIIDKGPEYDYIHPWLATGLLTSTGKLVNIKLDINLFFFTSVLSSLFTLIAGQKWHQRRKLLTPTFHFKILEDFVQVFNEQSAVLVERLNEKVGQDFDIFPYITLCTLDVICGTATIFLKLSWLC